MFFPNQGLCVRAIHSVIKRSVKKMMIEYLYCTVLYLLSPVCVNEETMHLVGTSHIKTSDAEC